MRAIAIAANLAPRSAYRMLPPTRASPGASRNVRCFCQPPAYLITPYRAGAIAAPRR